VLNVKQELDVRKMRAIAEEAFAMVREYKGSHSGEHGDGLVRSEHHEADVRAALVRAFEEVKDTFDPEGLFNPARSSARRRWMIAACSASSRITGKCRSTACSTGRNGAASPAPPRCATTTAPAANPIPA